MDDEDWDIEKYRREQQAEEDLTEQQRAEGLHGGYHEPEGGSQNGGSQAPDGSSQPDDSQAGGSQDDGSQGGE